MEFTGERYVPGVHGEIKLEHLQRYALCRSVIRGRRVLDLACGEGYGSALLAREAKMVVGVDIDAMTVERLIEEWAGIELRSKPGDPA